MELHQIRYFLAVCDEMSFTKAAQVTGVSQPALTKAIQKLEENLGGPLFIRSTRHLEPTELGRTMRKHLSKIDETCRTAKRAAQEFSSHGPSELNIGFMCTLGAQLFFPALAILQEQMPHVNIVLHDINNREASDLIRADALDCAIMVESPSSHANLRWTPLFEEDIHLAMNKHHPAAENAKSFSLNDLSEFQFIDRLSCEFRDMFIADLNDRGIQLNIALKAERDDWVHAALLSSNSVTLLPAYATNIEGLKLFPLLDYERKRSVGVLSRISNTHTFTALDQLISILADWPWNGQCNKVEQLDPNIRLSAQQMPV